MTEYDDIISIKPAMPVEGNSLITPSGLIHEQRPAPFYHLERAISRAVEQKQNLEEILHNFSGKIISKDVRNQEWLRSQGYSLYYTESYIRKAYEYYTILYQKKMLCLNRVPRTAEGKVACYHGTTQDRVESIKISGLRADQKDTGFSRAFQGRGKKGHIFVYIGETGQEEAIETAWYYADKGRRNSPPVLITCEIEPERLVPDLDSGKEEAFKIKIKRGSLPTSEIRDLSGTSLPPIATFFKKWQGEGKIS